MAAGLVARAAVCSKGVDGWADKRRSAGGTGPNILPSNDVRFCAHNGLMADIRPGSVFCQIQSFAQPGALGLLQSRLAESFEELCHRSRRVRAFALVPSNRISRREFLRSPEG